MNSTKLRVIEFKDLFIGMRVQDNEGNVGTVKECNDIHNVNVEYNNGGSGLHCLIEGCVEKILIDDIEVDIPHYDPLYYCIDFLN